MNQKFTGDYPANVQLPDGSVVLVQPGQVVDLSRFDAKALSSDVWAATTDAVTPEPDQEAIDLGTTDSPAPDPAPAPDAPPAA